MFLGCLANADAWLPVCLHLGVLLFLSCPHSCLPQAKYRWDKTLISIKLLAVTTILNISPSLLSRIYGLVCQSQSISCSEWKKFRPCPNFDSIFMRILLDVHVQDIYMLAQAIEKHKRSSRESLQSVSCVKWKRAMVTVVVNRITNSNEL